MASQPRRLVAWLQTFLCLLCLFSNIFRVTGGHHHLRKINEIWFDDDDQPLCYVTGQTFHFFHSFFIQSIVMSSSLSENRIPRYNDDDWIELSLTIDSKDGCRCEYFDNGDCKGDVVIRDFLEFPVISKSNKIPWS